MSFCTRIAGGFPRQTIIRKQQGNGARIDSRRLLCLSFQNKAPRDSDVVVRNIVQSKSERPEAFFSNVEYESGSVVPKTGNIVAAAALVTGTTIGAGILALPAVTQAAGVLPSSCEMVVCWILLVASGLLLAEVRSLPTLLFVTTPILSFLGESKHHVLTRARHYKVTPMSSLRAFFIRKFMRCIIAASSR